MATMDMTQGDALARPYTGQAGFGRENRRLVRARLAGAGGGQTRGLESDVMRSQRVVVG